MKKISLFSIILLSYFFNLCCCRYSLKDNHQIVENIRQFAPDNAQEIQIIQRGRITTLNYEIKMKFEPAELINYYNNKIGKYNFNAISFGNFGNKEWDVFINETLPDSPIVHQYIAVWSDSEKTSMIILVMRYFSFTSKSKIDCLKDSIPDNDGLHVSFQVQPFHIIPH